MALPNYEFYAGRRPAAPDKFYVHEYHQWKGDYDALEKNHNYIQWLFPITTQGENKHSVPLTWHERRLFIHSLELRSKVLTSYHMMLDFYGFRLIDDDGTLQRAAHWRSRFRNLTTNTHNYKRLTRIIRSLGLLGLGHMQEPLVRRLIYEFKVGTLPELGPVIIDYFIPAVAEGEEQRGLAHYFSHQCYTDELAKLGKSLGKAPGEADRAAYAALDYYNLF